MWACKYTTLLGKTADVGHLDGGSVDELQMVFGFRIAFRHHPATARAWAR